MQSTDLLTLIYWFPIFSANQVWDQLIKNPKPKLTKQDALQRISDLPIDQPIFFTIGSALGNPGPCGTGVVLYKNGMNSAPVSTSIPVANAGTSYLGELAGIESVLKTAVNLADSPSTIIMVDCTYVSYTKYL